jgi:hypothetical protein
VINWEDGMRKICHARWCVTGSTHPKDWFEEERDPAPDKVKPRYVYILILYIQEWDMGLYLDQYIYGQVEDDHWYKTSMLTRNYVIYRPDHRSERGFFKRWDWGRVEARRSFTIPRHWKKNWNWWSREDLPRSQHVTMNGARTAFCQSFPVSCWTRLRKGEF